MSPTEVSYLEGSEATSLEDRLNSEKTAIAEFAVTDNVIPELVEAYPDLVGSIPRFEDLQHGKDFAIERDSRTINRQFK
ncbi:MAG: hypothetical protein NVSMB70_19190 [Chamaesiphon sp.]